MWVSDSAQVWWWLSLQYSSQSHKPASPHTSLVFSTIPPLDPRMSGCEQDFVCWPFKRVPVPLSDSCLSIVDRILRNFHIQILCGCLFLAVVSWAGQLSMELRLFTLHGVPLQLPYLSEISAVAHGSQTSAFHVFALPTSLSVASSVNSWL